MVAVSPMNETLFVFGLTNFLGLINFFENVPNPLISTLSSKATASTIESKIISIASEISLFDSSGNSFFRDGQFSICYRIKISNF